MNKSWDLPLQILFMLGLLLLAAGFYVTRLAPLQASDQNNKPLNPYETFDSAYQFEQEEERINTQIKVLKADYASNLQVFLEERAKIINNGGLSELEKREKLAILDQLYNTEFFQHKIDLMDEQSAKLADLREKKCFKFCNYQDLPGGP